MIHIFLRGNTEPTSKFAESLVIQSFDRSGTRLGFMAAVRREDDSHATLLALICYLYGQM